MPLGLWEVTSGHVLSLPKHVGKDGVFFLPQRPYFTMGTLRAQVQCISTPVI